MHVEGSRSDLPSLIAADGVRCSAAESQLLIRVSYTRRYTLVSSNYCHMHACQVLV
jgi:hypothetical protein